MNLSSRFFYLILFLGFALPSNTTFYIPIPGVQFQIRELALILLPIINGFSDSKYKSSIKDKRLRYLIRLFLLSVLIFAALRVFIFDESLSDAFKAIRIGLPLYISLFLLDIGIRVDIRKVWQILLLAIISSFLISLVSIFIPLPIYSYIEGSDILEATNGRFINANASFGIIGLYLLFRDKDKWYNRGKLPLYASILSVVSLVLTFNRTYLVLLFLMLLYLAFTKFNIKNMFKIATMVLLGVLITFIAYDSSKAIRRQIDDRILDLVLQKTTIAASALEDNRDRIYEGIMTRLDQGYWMIGLPFSKPIFSYAVLGEDVGAIKTDISFVNIMLRNGFLSLFVFLILLFRMWKLAYLSSIVLMVYILASFNADSLYNQNSIFFFCIFFVLNLPSGVKIKRAI